jgi:Flp pilus assembly pilin Flp
MTKRCTSRKLVVSAKRGKSGKGSNGQTLVEYALILAFISVTAIFVLQALGSKVTAVFSTINSKLSAAQSSS